MHAIDYVLPVRPAALRGSLSAQRVRPMVSSAQANHTEEVLLKSAPHPRRYSKEKLQQWYCPSCVPRGTHASAQVLMIPSLQLVLCPPLAADKCASGRHFPAKGTAAGAKIVASRAPQLSLMMDRRGPRLTARGGLPKDSGWADSLQHILYVQEVLDQPPNSIDSCGRACETAELCHTMQQQSCSGAHVLTGSHSHRNRPGRVAK